MSKCKICGARIEDGTAVCPSCGAKVADGTAGQSTIASASMIKAVCPSCGAEVIGEHRFCPQCGGNLKEAAGQSNPAPAPKERRCPSCGSILQANSHFCHNCGTSISILSENNDMSSELKKANEAYTAGNYKTAVAYYSRLAEQGNAEAQNKLGQMYYRGDGVRTDYHKALYYFNLSAEQGNANSQYYLGLIYEGYGAIKKDHDESLKYYRMAAENGDPDAQKLFR